MSNKYSEEKNRFSAQAIFIILILLGISLRLYQLGRTLGGGDENAMLLYFGYYPFDYIVTTYYEASNHVFHTVLVHLMTVWFGEENAFAIRFPSFIFGITILEINEFNIWKR